jgi:recombination protein RecA
MALRWNWKLQCSSNVGSGGGDLGSGKSGTRRQASTGKSAKEHIANLEQIGYIAFIAAPPRQSFVPDPNPRHKEHDPMSTTALRIVEGSSMDKTKALAAALSQIERQFGKGSVMKLGKNDRSMDVEAISSGSLGLDIALGIGGLPKGRVVEIYGPESSGKTTLALHTVAEGQKKGGICAFIDAEHALDPVYARKLGVNIDELLISQPDTGEQALEICDTLVRSGAVDVLVIDSVAALVPKAELEGEMGDALPGLQARLMSQALRKLTASINKSNTMVIFINQIRMKIGVMYGSPETTTGGNALKFYASIRLDIRRIGAIKERDEVVGNTTRVKVVKNKLAPPFKQVEFDIMYGEGVSKMGEILDLGVKAGIVEKSGAWFSYDSQRLGQGRENSKAFLKANPDITAKIETSIRQNSGLIAEQILAGSPERDADGEEPADE